MNFTMTREQAEAESAKNSANINMVMLSILMPTIPERKKRFNKLLSEVYRQIHYCKKTHPVLGVVQVISDERKKFSNGGPSIGAKRQSLLQEAQGKYCCFLDDDEEISPDYIETLLRLCREDKDVCTFNDISKFDNYWCVVRLSLAHEKNEQARPGIINRRPWHICPVRTELAKKAVFPESNYGEDWVWFEQVVKMCKTEEHTEAILHSYIHSLKVSQADNVTTAI